MKLCISALFILVNLLCAVTLPAAEPKATVFRPLDPPLDAVIPQLVIHGGQMFDSAACKMKPIGAIVIQGNRIKAIIPEGDPVTIPPDARVIDGRGKFLIPGLIDGHVHLVHILRNMQMTADEIFPLFLANGVTALRNVGDEVVAEKLLTKYTEAHPECAPRLFMGSLLIDGNPPYHPFISRSITDATKVPEFVDEMVAWGVQTFKIYVSADRAVGLARAPALGSGTTASGSR